MRILLWSPSGAGLHYGGAGMTAYRMYQELPAPHRVDLVHGFREQERTKTFAQHHLLAPVFTSKERANPTATFSRLHRAIFSQMYLQSAKKWLGQNAYKYDIFHGLGDGALTLLPAVIAEQLGLPAILKVTIHREYVERELSFRNWLSGDQRVDGYLHDVSSIIALSPEIRQSLRKFGVPDERVVTLPNGVDVTQFRPVRCQHERSQLRSRFNLNSRFIVAFVGAIERRKRPHLVVRATLKLLRANADVQIILVGPLSDPKYAREMREEILQAGAGAHVNFLGHRRDVDELLRASDVLCLPSQTEGMANAVLEAMSSGLPAVVTPTSGMETLVKHEETGLIVEPNPTSIFEALYHYFRHPNVAKVHGANGRNIIVKKFSSRKIMERHLEVFSVFARDKQSSVPGGFGNDAN